ncbi:MAG: nucleotidyl transferase AbiEii/AbiGii toxin family protein [Bacteroidales bacterium]|nr:nucleotidyl transferase AbiEii/AbiGii toxin family protein [Bacteroidales bacterium]
MEDSLMLHQHPELFRSAIKETAENLNIRNFFIEKDYWISLVLRRLSESRYVDSVVFKGGTSLSKGYRLINRFSEDVDIAVIDLADSSGNQLKTLIRTVEKEIAQDLVESTVEGITSKGSRFRKSVYQYPEIQKTKKQVTYLNTLIVEINSFANPYPYSKLEIQSLIGEYFHKNNQTDFIKKYSLEPFKVNILDINQTFIEKLVSLIRFSFAENYLEELSGKIRHFYDLYFLLNDKDCYRYFESSQFMHDFKTVLTHDQGAFDEPKGWNTRKMNESPIFNNFDKIWEILKSQYTKELSLLAFTEIPDEREISQNFGKIIKAFE